jgi:hypothetical protein
MDVADTTENLQSGQREPAWRPARAIGAAEMPRNIFRYVLKTSGWHQLFLLLLTVGVFLLEVVPLELQRRIVNDLVITVDSRGDIYVGEVSWTAWPQIYPGKPHPANLRSLQKFEKVE